MSRMTASEVEVWGAYRAKYGSLNPVRKYDRSGAIVSAILSKVYGGKAEPEDFFLQAKPEQAELTPEQHIALLSKGSNVSVERKFKVNGKRR